MWGQGWASNNFNTATTFYYSNVRNASQTQQDDCSNGPTDLQFDCTTSSAYCTSDSLLSGQILTSLDNPPACGENASAVLSMRDIIRINRMLIRSGQFHHYLLHKCGITSHTDIRIRSGFRHPEAISIYFTQFSLMPSDSQTWNTTLD